MENEISVQKPCFTLLIFDCDCVFMALALRFPNNVELIIALDGLKLFLFRGANETIKLIESLNFSAV